MLSYSFITQILLSSYLNQIQRQIHPKSCEFVEIFLSLTMIFRDCLTENFISICLIVIKIHGQW